MFVLKMFTILKFGNFWLNKAVILLIALVLALNTPIKEVSAAWDYSDVAALINSKQTSGQNSLLITGGDSIMGVNAPPQHKIMRVVLTAYSSTPDQTKPDDPFTMASGKRVYDGAIAANFLSFGTRVKIPEISGDKIFTVEDRMNRRFSERIDIWFPERRLAKLFGIQEAEIIILD